jgi:hypothetical protein
LPKWFYPTPEKPALSSHEKIERWCIEENSCLVQSVARGQEFILDVTRFPEATDWAVNIIRGGFSAGGM